VKISPWFTQPEAIWGVYDILLSDKYNLSYNKEKCPPYRIVGQTENPSLKLNHLTNGVLIVISAYFNIGKKGLLIHFQLFICQQHFWTGRFPPLHPFKKKKPQLKFWVLWVLSLAGGVTFSSEAYSAQKSWRLQSSPTQNDLRVHN